MPWCRYAPADLVAWADTAFAVKAVAKRAASPPTWTPPPSSGADPAWAVDPRPATRNLRQPDQRFGPVRAQSVAAEPGFRETPPSSKGARPPRNLGVTIASAGSGRALKKPSAETALAVTGDRWRRNRSAGDTVIHKPARRRRHRREQTAQMFAVAANLQPWSTSDNPSPRQTRPGRNPQRNHEREQAAPIVGRGRGRHAGAGSPQVERGDVPTCQPAAQLVIVCQPERETTIAPRHPWATSTSKQTEKDA